MSDTAAQAATRKLTRRTKSKLPVLPIHMHWTTQWDACKRSALSVSMPVSIMSLSNLIMILFLIIIIIRILVSFIVSL